MPYEIIRGDITEIKADAIVNTANPMPVVGYGVDSGIHQKAGPKLLKAREKVGIIAPGEAAITPGYRLPAKYVIHAVSPQWEGGSKGEQEVLRKTYRSALALAVRKECKSVAFPLLASGHYGFPKELALQIAVESFQEFLEKHEIQILLVVFDRKAFQLSASLVASVESFIDETYVKAKLNQEFGLSEDADDEVRRHLMNQRRLSDIEFREYVRRQLEEQRRRREQEQSSGSSEVQGAQKPGDQSGISTAEEKSRRLDDVWSGAKGPGDEEDREAEERLEEARYIQSPSGMMRAEKADGQVPPLPHRSSAGADERYSSSQIMESPKRYKDLPHKASSSRPQARPKNAGPSPERSVRRDGAFGAGLMPSAIGQLHGFIPESLQDKLAGKEDGFSATLLRLIDESGRTDVDVYKRANVDRRLFSKIRSNPQYNPSKQLVLAFAIALELDLEDTQDLLYRAGYTLSHSNVSDIVVEYCINNHMYNIYEVNNLLFEFDGSLLGSVRGGA